MSKEISSQLVLGSGSPRRQALLRDMGYQFTLRKAEVEEEYPSGLAPLEVPSYLAKLKAQHIAIAQNEVLLTADTVVIFENRILEKPTSAEDAKSMLRQLRGKQHVVCSGVSILSADKQVVFSDTTEVAFEKMDDAAIAHYVKHYNPYDKAGAYGVQEWWGYVAVKYIRGSFYNVMGLPTHKVFSTLREFNI